MKPKTMTHTPGPWAALDTTVEGPPQEGCELPTVIAYCDSENYGPALDDRAANARLIASAPDLLAALEKLARLGNGEHYGNSDGNMIARAAIARAKGDT